MDARATDDIKTATSFKTTARKKAWLEAERRRRGLRSVSAVIDALITEAMEQSEERAA